MNDLPARIVSAAASYLPKERREWGEAMIAELAQLRNRSDRLEFAIGCARAAFVAPTLGEHGILRMVPVTFLGGLAASLALTTYVAVTWPHAVSAISPGTMWSFVIALLVYLWLGLRPHALMTRGAAPRRGVAAGFILFAATGIGRVTIEAVAPLPTDDTILGVFLIVVFTGVVATTAFSAAHTERSVSAGIIASLWTGLVCSILAFNADLGATLTDVNVEAHISGVIPTYAGDDLTPDAFLDRHIGDHLASSMEGLRSLPLLALTLGSISAAIGRLVGASQDRRIAAAQ